MSRPLHGIIAPYSLAQVLNLLGLEPEHFWSLFRIVLILLLS